MRSRSVTDEPRTSTWLDVIAFVFTFVLGVLAYFAIRLWSGGEAQTSTTAALIVLMLSYSAAVIWVPRLRIRMDQAGDNSYYLGLLFTLSSMAFALYDFRTVTQQAASAAGVQQIISNFGIALATTIAGIFLRVALHQMRLDPADLEAMTRIELTEAAERLRSTLETITTDLGRFHLELQQRSADVFTEVSNAAGKAASKMTSATEESYERVLATTEGLTKQLGSAANDATGAMERLRAVAPPPLALSKRLDTVASVLERVASQAERTTEGLRAVLDAASQSIEALRVTSENLDRLADGIIDKQSGLSDRLGGAMSTLEGSLTSFAAGLDAIALQVSQLDTQLKQSTDASLSAQQAASDVLNHLVSLTRNLVEVLNSVGQSPHARS